MNCSHVTVVPAFFALLLYLLMDVHMVEMLLTCMVPLQDDLVYLVEGIRHSTNHPNIIQFWGVVLDHSPALLVSEPQREEASLAALLRRAQKEEAQAGMNEVC
jgi:hypothetical protein